MSHVVRLTGTVRLDAPVSIIIHGTTEKDAPSSVPTTAVWDPDVGGMVNTVCIPSSSIRGGLRRAAVADLTARRKEAGLEGFNLRSFYMLAIGGTRSRGSKSITHDASAEKAIRSRNPFMSLFGGADLGDAYFMHSKLALGHLLPSSPVSPDSCPVFPAVRVDDLLRRPDRVLPDLNAAAGDAWSELHQKTTATSALKKERTTLKAAAGKARKAGDTATLRQAAERLRTIEEILDSSTTSTQMLVAGYRALPAGLVLQSDITLRDVSDAELGLFLSALREFSFDPVIGGHRAHGCGRVSANWSLSVGAPRTRLEKIGDVVIDANGILLPSHQVVDAAEKAWAAAAVTSDFSYQIGDVEEDQDEESAAA